MNILSVYSLQKTDSKVRDELPQYAVSDYRAKSPNQEIRLVYGRDKMAE